MDAVRIEVLPHPIAYRSDQTAAVICDQTRVDVFARCARSEHHDTRGAVLFARVAVAFVAPLIGGAEMKACRGMETHAVSARQELCEMVSAVGCSNGRGHGNAGGVEQLDHHARVTVFVGILLTVCIRVGPHPIAHRSQLEQPGIEVRARLPREQGNHGGFSVSAHVAVLAGIPALLRRAELEARGCGKRDAVTPGDQAAKAILAGCGSERGRHHGTCSVE